MKNYGCDFLKLMKSAILILLLLMLPEFIFGIINPKFALCYNFDKLGVILILSLILATLKSIRVVGFFVMIFGVMQIIQFCNMAYFGVYLTPFALEFIFLESRDIMTEIKSIWYQYLYILLLVGVPYFLLGYGLCKGKIKRWECKYSVWFLALFFAYFFYNASTPNGIFQMLFKNTCYASYNTINSFSAYLGNVLPKSLLNHEVGDEFEAYKVENIEKNKNEPTNVIFVVGESMNAGNMSLFGYERKTTPELVKYAEEDKNFVYERAWGAAVNTLISLPMIYNIQVNPKNYKKLIMQDSNLMKMAKDNGFRVTYVEMQNEEVFRKTSVSNYDKLYSYDEENGAEVGGERGFLESVFKEINLDGRNFIVIHKRNVHSPYENNYMYEKEDYNKFRDGGNERINGYDNSVLYEDMLIKKIIDFAKSAKQKTYFYYISDHGEALGQNGIWGHGHLDRADLEVPFMFTMFNAEDKEYLGRVRGMKNLCAYDISLIVAEKLGYKVEILGEDMNVCLINGRDSMGRAGILRVTRMSDGSVKLEKRL